MRISDWSSDVCSSDLRRNRLRRQRQPQGQEHRTSRAYLDLDAGRRRSHGSRGGGNGSRGADRKSVVSGKSVSVRVDLGGRRRIKKKKKVPYKHTNQTSTHDERNQPSNKYSTHD